jgi:peptidoglycan/xylan/chitin deacetylase (PgdA/CDA1 family)
MTEIMVLCYHAVSPSWESTLAVTPAEFERQMKLLDRRGWRAATFADALVNPPGPRTVAITFDDAYRSIQLHARPVLAALSWPATVFVPTAFASSRQTLTWPGIEQWLGTPSAGELLSMDWDDLRGLEDDGWEIGSHTCTHPHLTALSDDELRGELTASLEACSEHMRHPCRTIAYPYGDTDARVARAAGEAGYAAGAALSSSLRGGEPLRWPRVGIYDRDAGRRFELKVSRITRWLRASPLWR